MNLDHGVTGKKRRGEQSKPTRLGENMATISPSLSTSPNHISMNHNALIHMMLHGAGGVTMWRSRHPGTATSTRRTIPRFTTADSFDSGMRQTFSNREAGQGNPVMDVELGHEIVGVFFDRLLAELHDRGDFLLGQSAGDVL